MTMRLDIVTNDTGELVRREHARELGAGVVVAIYRLVKVAQMHDLGNAAFLRQLEQTHQMIGEYCLRSGSNVSVLFAHKATFVAGQLLKGNRGAYEAAAELGELLERIGGSELSISRDITREELNAFAEQISQYHRTNAPVRLPPKMHLRRVADAARLRGLELENLTPDQRIVRAYASAVVIMRRFFEDLSGSRYILPRRIKRIAQSLVDLSDASTASYLGVTEVRNANYDEAGRAVNTAILAVSIARETTQNRTVLAQIAMAAMMHDVARPRALALAASAGGPMPGMAGPATLSEDQEDRLAAGAAAVLTALGRVNEPSITRTVLTFEALWLRRRTWLGPVYWGARPPTMHASIIAIARRYNDLLTPEPGLPPPTTDFAVATLANELTEAQDRTVLRMLVSALGLLPTGTLVQLSTGEVAEVVRGTTRLGEKAVVHIVGDANGQSYAQPIEVDLAKDPRRTVLAVLGVDGWSKGLAQGPNAEGYDPEADEDDDAPAAAESEPSGPSAGSGPSHSVGTSPSQVAQAMGRMISLPPAAPAESEGFERNAIPSHAPAPAFAGSAPARPEATARGTLAATPLPHVLVYMLDHALTGTVVFETGGPGAEEMITFVEGVPTKVHSSSAFARLGEVLVENGVLDANTVDRAVATVKKIGGTRLGAYLVNNSLISDEALAWALEDQLLRRLANAANLAPEIEYAFYRDVDLLEEASGEIHVGHPLNPVLAAVRSWNDRARVGATLGRIGGHPLAIHADADLDALSATPEERAVLDALAGGEVTLSALAQLQLADEETIASLVYTLAVTRQLAFKGQKKGPMAPRGSGSRSVATSASTKPAAAAFASSANPFASSINPFAAAPSTAPKAPPPLPAAAPPPAPASTPSARPAASPGPLRPPTPATRATIGSRPQIRPIAKKPSATSQAPAEEKAPESNPGDGRTIAEPPEVLKEMMAARIAAARAIAPATKAPVGAQMKAGQPTPLVAQSPSESPKGNIPVGKATGAALPPTSVRKTVRGLAPSDDELLSTDVKRSAFDLDDVVQTAPSMPQASALEAMSSFRLAESSLQRNDLASAEAHAKKALDADPNQPDYVTLLAWIRAHTAPQTIDDAIRTMSRVLIEDPAHERALLYRAKLLVRKNRLPEALNDVSELLGANPHHREAQELARQVKAKIG